MREEFSEKIALLINILHSPSFKDTGSTSAKKTALVKTPFEDANSTNTKKAKALFDNPLCKKNGIDKLGLKTIECVINNNHQILRYLSRRMIIVSDEISLVRPFTSQEAIFLHKKIMQNISIEPENYTHYYKNRAAYKNNTAGLLNLLNLNTKSTSHLKKLNEYLVFDIQNQLRSIDNIDCLLNDIKTQLEGKFQFTIGVLNKLDSHLTIHSAKKLKDLIVDEDFLKKIAALATIAIENPKILKSFTKTEINLMNILCPHRI